MKPYDYNGRPRREKRYFYISLLFVAAVATLVKGVAVALTARVPSLEVAGYFGAFALLVLLLNFSRRTQREEDYFSRMPWRLRDGSRTPYLSDRIEAVTVTPSRSYNAPRPQPRVVSRYYR